MLTPNPAKEIGYIIRSLKNNKTPGEAEIVAELLKVIDPNLPQELEHLFKRIWDEEEIPKEWKCALIHLLHKKGDRTNFTTIEGFPYYQ